nr:helix-turn-helix domain-containing protein [Pyrococcus yayanosii]
MKRSVTVKLQPSKEQEKILFELAQATAIIWNKMAEDPARGVQGTLERVPDGDPSNLPANGEG